MALIYEIYFINSVEVRIYVKVYEDAWYRQLLYIYKLF